MEEEFTSVCSNPWCKATFRYTENDFIKSEGQLIHPKECKKCKSFSNEMSGGVEWKDKTYEGDRFDGVARQISYKVTNFKL